MSGEDSGAPARQRLRGRENGMLRQRRELGILFCLCSGSGEAESDKGNDDNCDDGVESRASRAVEGIGYV